MRRMIASLGVALLLIVGSAVPAQALTVHKTGTCTWVKVVANPPYMGCFQWWLYDYNWWEETFQNKKDHWSHVLIKRSYVV